jgi:hypothetical protein
MTTDYELAAMLRAYGGPARPVARVRPAGCPLTGESIRVDDVARRIAAADRGR